MRQRTPHDRVFRRGRLAVRQAPEVKTSVDRYANLEVNYLLQRLDSFEASRS